MLTRRILPLLVAFAVSVAAADKKKSDVTEIGNRKVDRGINLYSLEKEIALGKQLAQEVQRQAKILDDPIVTEFVNRLGQNLVRNSDAKLPFEFRVIDSRELNAFALPGGFIFVNTGLIQAAESEAELAGAIAHEIAHVAARHSTRQASQRQIADIAALPLSILLGGWTGMLARQGANLAIPMTFLSFGRAYESEADYLGTQYMYAAGYDPTAQVDLFERLQSLERKTPGAISKLFASHPMNKDRIAKTQQEIGTILPNRAEYIMNTSEYVEMRARVLRHENRARMTRQDDKSPVLLRRELVE